ncbi:MAG: hypothetical protein P4L53_09675 [Candidatus Obscuribacterales bacterium]|nr:hypothetical protein [Candidatus Obscuribacterales bacterium]
MLSENTLLKTAIFWIRDGVLIDRMSVNAVAFAVAWANAFRSGESASFSLTALVNFAFATSGISCAEKMHQLNVANSIASDNVQLSVDFYNQLAAEAGKHCQYFAGAPQLLEKAHDLGVLNFITSAVEQTVLDRWGASDQALSIAPYLAEILGWRSTDFCKGAGHFEYVRKHYGVERIIYVADAVAEIASGFQYGHTFGVVPVGFAALISREKVMHAFTLVLQAQRDLGLTQPGGCIFSIEPDSLSLPNQDQLDWSLKNAGAARLVSGSADRIMSNLEELLVTEILPQSKNI